MRPACWAVLVLAATAGQDGRNLLDNASFESADGELPRGWACIVAPAHRRSVDFTFDEKEAKDGTRSVRIKNPEPANVAANSFTQKIDGNTAADLRGKWVELSGFVKGRNAVSADLWIQCFDDADRELARYRTRRYGSFSGTFDWSAGSAKGEIPRKTRTVMVRCVLTGTGEVWFDGLKLRETKPAKAAEIAKLGADDAERRDAIAKWLSGSGEKPVLGSVDEAIRALAHGIGPAPWAVGYKRFSFQSRGREWSYEVWIPEEARRGGAWPMLVDPGHPKGQDDHKNWVAMGAKDLFVLRSSVLDEIEKSEEMSKLAVHEKDALQAEVLAAMLRDARLRLPVDPDRIYWTGLSMTAYTAWSFAVRHPDFVTAAAPFAGMPRNVQAFAGNLAGQGWYVVHGDADTVCQVKWTRAMVEALKTAGVDHVYRELAGLGHSEVIIDRGNALEWMSTRVRDAVPRRVSMKLLGDGGAWWIDAKVPAKAPAWTEEKGFEPLGSVTAEVKDNVITISADGVTALRVWLNAKFVDFSKPVKIVLNGRASEHAVAPSMDRLLERLHATADAGALYSAAIDVDVK